MLTMFPHLRIPSFKIQIGYLSRNIEALYIENKYLNY